MLIEFRVRNYLCFKDEQVLSMVASASDTSLPENCIEAHHGLKRRLLRSVVVYGPNASGKTKLLDGLNTLNALVQDSARLQPDERLPVAPFLLDIDTRGAPSEFEVTFFQDDVRYQYGFSVTRERIWREYLYAAPHGRTVPYFDRQWDPESKNEEYAFGPSLRGENQRIRGLTRPNALFLSVAATFNHPMLSGPYAWFAHKLVGVKAPLELYRALFWRPTLPKESNHERIKQLIQAADLGIDDYRLKVMKRVSSGADATTSSTGDQDRVQTAEAKTDLQEEIEMLHRTADQGMVPIRLHDESNGTIQVFNLSERLLDVLSRGGVLYVDELGMSMHPALVRELVGMFHNPEINKCNAQLIFNTHDTSLLDRDLFRRDQVWLTEKDANGAAHLYSLLDFHPRGDAALAKGYLQGRYGAIPYIGDLASIFAESKCP
jgi:hypothetical protein